MIRNLVALGILLAGLRLAVEGHGGMLVAAMVLAFFVAKASGTASPAGAHYLTAHAHGSDRKLIAKHEAGHAVVVKAHGGRVISAEVGDDWGLVRAHTPNDPVKRVAFLSAGRYSAGTGRGCSADDASIRRVLRGVPSKHRGQVKRDGVSLAKKTVSRNRGAINSYASKLEKNGRL